MPRRWRVWSWCPHCWRWQRCRWRSPSWCDAAVSPFPPAPFWPRLNVENRPRQERAGRMSRWVLALGVVMALSGCAGNKTPPKDLDNACSIAAQRPQYVRAMEATERKWNVPVPVQMAIIHQESKFDGDARTPYRWVLGVIPMGRQSSAFGYSQALDGTWAEYKRETG